jgi:hypothetical protein
MTFDDAADHPNWPLELDHVRHKIADEMSQKG